MTDVTIDVNPGVCGFDCRINAERSDKKTARIEIVNSSCAMIQNLSEHLNDISIQDLFTPLTVNPIFTAAQKADCHLACPVPTAIVKAAEVVLELAVPKNAAICFLKTDGSHPRIKP